MRNSTGSHHVKDALLLPQWFSLTDVKSGRVHLILEWLPKASDSDSLDQVGCARLMCSTCAPDERTDSYSHAGSFILFPCVQVLQFYSRQSYQNKAVPSAGLLFVFIEQANGLPVSILSSVSKWRTGSRLFHFLFVFYFCKSLKRVARSQRWEQRSPWEQRPVKLQ